jgi:hypothetical protein
MPVDAILAAREVLTTLALDRLEFAERVVAKGRDREAIAGPER